jgi:hypothetical protein
MRTKYGLFVALALALGTMAAMADTIATLDTGVDNSGASLPNGATDNHWLITPPGAAGQVSTDVNYQAGLKTSGVNWNNAVGIIPTGVPLPISYTYSINFTINTLMYSSFSLSATAWADDSITAVSLSNSGGANLLTPSLVNGATLFSTSEQSLFADGLNTLTLTVKNVVGPTGLLLTGAVTATAVPEASEWAMLIGAAGLGLLTYRKQLAALIKRDAATS